MTQKEKDEKFNELRISLVEAEMQIQDIRKELDELDKAKIEPESRRWKPKKGQIYSFISDLGAALSTTWTGGCHDSLRFAIGNVFETDEEAEFEVERLKVIAELKEFAEPEDRVGDGHTNHYHISCYGDISDSISIFSCSVVKNPTIYFESEEKAREALRAVGEDRIKKYYLRVKG